MLITMYFFRQGKMHDFSSQKLSLPRSWESRATQASEPRSETSVEQNWNPRRRSKMSPFTTTRSIFKLWSHIQTIHNPQLDAIFL